MYQSPCGALLLGSYGARLCLCDWEAACRCKGVETRVKRMFHAELVTGESSIVCAAASQLDEYFAGMRRNLSLPLAFAGTDFQRMVWNELLKIDYGTRITYSDVTRLLGLSRAAVRAVANAIGSNVISLFVPCHRVVGSNNRLTGYRGGLAAKEYLLNLEEKICRKDKKEDASLL